LSAFLVGEELTVGQLCMVGGQLVRRVVGDGADETGLHSKLIVSDRFSSRLLTWCAWQPTVNGTRIRGPTDGTTPHG
jgi:hypothetical protein